jgi:S-adenosylmethionine hydrolase
MSTKRIITFLSDFGTADGYAGSVKGVIRHITPDCEIIDITHEIPPYHITGAAFTLLNFYRYFPSDTIHLAVVDPGVGGYRKPVILRTAHHYFVGPDNGIFQYILQREACKAYEVNLNVVARSGFSATFHARDIFAPTAAYLARGTSPGELGTKIENPGEYSSVPFERAGDRLSVKSVAIDHFGNIIAGFCRQDLARLQKSAVSRVELRGFITTKLNSSYQQVEKGQPLALWNSQDFLEIAINQGNASRHFNFDPLTDSIDIIVE